MTLKPAKKPAEMAEPTATIPAVTNSLDANDTQKKRIKTLNNFISHIISIAISMAFYEVLFDFKKYQRVVVVAETESGCLVSAN